MPTIADYYQYAKLATAAYVTLDGQPLDPADDAARSDSLGRLPAPLANQMFDSEGDVWTIASPGAYYGNDGTDDGTGFAATLDELFTLGRNALRKCG